MTALLVGLWQFLADRGGMLLLGSGGLLALGSCALLLTRVPIHRQRLCELTLLSTVGWLVLACLPLPRLSIRSLLPSSLSWPATARAVIRLAAEQPSAVVGVSGPVELGAGNRPAAAVPKLEAFRAGPVQADADERSTKSTCPRAPTTESVPPIIDPTGMVHATSLLATPWSEELPGPPQPSLEYATFMTDYGLNATATAAATAPTPAAAAQPVLDQPALDPPALDEPAPTAGIQRAMLAGLYLFGAAGSAGYILLGRLRLFQTTYGASPPPAWVAELFESLPVDGRRPRILVARRCDRPMCYGLGRGTIVLPADLCRRERQQLLRQVLLHELGHVIQHDARGNVLFSLALPLLYCQPCYWLLRREARLSAELIADDFAARVTNKFTYASELLALVKERHRPRIRYVAAAGVFRSKNEFFRRVEMLMERTQPLATHCSRRWHWFSRLAGLATVAALASVVGLPAATVEARQSRPVEERRVEERRVEERRSERRAQAGQASERLEQERAAIEKEVEKLEEQLKALNERMRELTRDSTRWPRAEARQAIRGRIAGPERAGEAQGRLLAETVRRAQEEAARQTRDAVAKALAEAKLSEKLAKELSPEKAKDVEKSIEKALAKARIGERMASQLSPERAQQIEETVTRALERAKIADKLSTKLSDEKVKQLHDAIAKALAQAHTAEADALKQAQAALEKARDEQAQWREHAQRERARAQEERARAQEERDRARELAAKERAAAQPAEKAEHESRPTPRARIMARAAVPAKPGTPATPALPASPAAPAPPTPVSPFGESVRAGGLGGTSLRAALGSRLGAGADGLAAIAGTGGSASDLLELATTAFDLHGNLRKAKVRADRLKQLGNRGAASREELELAQVDLETAEQKLNVARAIVQAELATTQSKLKKVQARPGVDPDRVTELQAREKILSTILGGF